MFYPGFFQNPSIYFACQHQRQGQLDLTEKWKSSQTFFLHQSARSFWLWQLCEGEKGPSDFTSVWPQSAPLLLSWFFSPRFCFLFSDLSAAGLAWPGYVESEYLTRMQLRLRWLEQSWLDIFFTDRTDPTICPSFVNNILPYWSHEIRLHNLQYN